MANFQDYPAVCLCPCFLWLQVSGIYSISQVWSMWVWHFPLKNGGPGNSNPHLFALLEKVQLKESFPSTFENDHHRHELKSCGMNSELTAPCIVGKAVPRLALHWTAAFIQGQVWYASVAPNSKQRNYIWHFFHRHWRTLNIPYWIIKQFATNIQTRNRLKLPSPPWRSCVSHMSFSKDG